MPIIDLNKNYVSGMQAPMQPLEQPKEVDHSTGTIFGAAMRQSNMVGSFVSSLETRAIVDVAKEDMVEGYNPLDDNLDGYELDLFTSSFSPRATQAIKDQADKERKDKQILSEAGALGFGMEIGATLLDPAQWGLAVSTGGLGWVGKGASLTTKAVRAGIVSGSTEVVIEGGLHYTQNSRTLLESAMNVGGATVFGGLLFGGAAKFMDIKTSKLQKLADDHQVNVNNPAYDSTLPENIELINMSSADHQNMGAALRGTIESLDDLGVAGVAGRVLEKTQGSELGKAVTLSTPAHRGVTTESVTFRNLNSRLFETSFVLNKNYGGNLETSLSKGLASANVKGLINESSNDLTVEAFEIELKALVSAKIENKISPLEAGQEAFNETLHKHFSEFDNDSGYVRGFREAYTKEYSRDGLASNFSAETLIANESDAVQVVMFKAAKKATQEAKAEGGAPRTLADIREAAGKAIINGTIADDAVGGLATQSQSILKQYGERAKDAGILKEELDLTDNYLPRVYNIETIEANSNDFNQLITEHFVQGSKKVALGAKSKIDEHTAHHENLNQLVRKLDSEDLYVNGKMPDDLFKSIEESLLVGDKYLLPQGKWIDPKKSKTKENMTEYVTAAREILYKLKEKSHDRLMATTADLTPMTRTEARLAANALHDTLVNNDGFVTAAGMKASLDNVAGFAKERTLNIDSKDLIDIALPGGSKVDFIITDVDYVLGRHAKEVAAEIHIKESIEDLGFESFEAMKTKIIDEAHLTGNTSRVKKDFDDLEIKMDSIKGRSRGTHNDPSSIAATAYKGFDALTSTSMLGKVLFTSIPDVSFIVANRGASNAAIGMAKATKMYLGTLVKHKKSQAQLEQLQAFGIGTERMLSKRIRGFANADQNAMPTTKAQRIIQNGQDTFFKWVGMNEWTDFVRAGNAFAMGHEILKSTAELAAGKKVNPKKMAQWASLGLDKNDLLAIAGEVKKHGTSEGTIRIANPEKWTDRDLARRYELSLFLDSRNTIVEVGASDRANWMTATPLNKALSKFQTYFFAANSRQTFTFTQRPITQSAGALTVAVGMGQLSMVLKEYLKPESKQDFSKFTDQEPLEFVMSGIERSGLIPQITYLNKVAALSGINLWGSSDMSRYQERGAMSSLLGPTYSYAENITQLAIAIGNGKNEEAIKRARRSMFGQNYPLLSPLYDIAEEELIKQVK